MNIFFFIYIIIYIYISDLYNCTSLVPLVENFTTFYFPGSLDHTAKWNPGAVQPRCVEFPSCRQCVFFFFRGLGVPQWYIPGREFQESL